MGKLEEEDLQFFAAAVCERFENPFIDHALLSICLNSVSKWKTRVLPSVLDSLRLGILPHGLILSFAALTAFYANGKNTEDGFVGTRIREGKSLSYPIRDSEEVISFFAVYGDKEDILTRFSARTDFWGMDLGEIPEFLPLARLYYDKIRKKGILSAMQDAMWAWWC